MRGLRHRLADGALDLLQLLHKVGLRMQAPGGVDHDRAHAAGPTGLHRGEGNGSGVRPGLAADEFAGKPVCPQPELLDGAGAKGVGCPQQDGAAFTLEPRRDLGHGCGLARPVDAHDEVDQRVTGGGKVPGAPFHSVE